MGSKHKKKDGKSSKADKKSSLKHAEAAPESLKAAKAKGKGPKVVKSSNEGTPEIGAGAVTPFSAIVPLPEPVPPALEQVAPAKPTLRERQSALKLKYRVRPDSALITSAVHSVTEEGGDPRRVRIAVDGGSGTVFDIGAHVAVGGDDDLPCSGDVFLASLAACQELTIRLVAAALSLPIHKLVVRVEGDWDVRGTLAIERSSPVGFTDIRVKVELETEGADDRIERLLKSAERYCVVGQTLEHAPEVVFSANVTNTAHQLAAD